MISKCNCVNGKRKEDMSIIVHADNMLHLVFQKESNEFEMIW